MWHFFPWLHRQWIWFAQMYSISTIPISSLIQKMTQLTDAEIIPHLKKKKTRLPAHALVVVVSQIIKHSTCNKCSSRNHLDWTDISNKGKAIVWTWTFCVSWVTELMYQCNILISPQRFLLWHYCEFITSKGDLAKESITQSSGSFGHSFSISPPKSLRSLTCSSISEHKIKHSFFTPALIS